MAFSLPLYNSHPRYIKTTERTSHLFVLLCICVFLISYLSIYHEWTLTENEKDTKRLIEGFAKEFPNAAAGANPFDPVKTEERLNHFYPYSDKKSKIPFELIQMWREMPDHPDFPYKDLYQIWTEMNPTLVRKFDTNANITNLIKKEFAKTVPEVAATLDMLPSMILKADFSRYVMLFLFGGVYADLDVKDINPMLDWFDTNRDVGFVCSLEMDSNEPWPYPMPRRNQLQTWFFKSKARHPILRKLIATVIKNTFEATDKKLIPDYSNDYDPASRPHMLSIMDWTGPPLMTDIVFAHMNSLNNPTVIDIDPIRWNLQEKLNGPELEPGRNAP
ncbi:unnamed protein product [Ambrosiozyma monospora]|uniref:Unnamed protein product n=1 Tax=Ambrosiozyma monospora TaxID=43982 RepID=A0A9W6Z680_AMBMO|nr:unnamed protein product [Ambrosiozyma monospora]